MAADPSKLSFFSLPGEIRNKIMNLVLVPGDVYPHTPVPKISTRVPISAANVESRSGVQLIATCRQAYNEGHALFYSSNTFHLPATETFEWSDRLQPKHKYLIKRISITIGPNELDASMISHIKETYIFRISNPSEFRDEPEGVLEAHYNTIEQAVLNTLGKAWNSKMMHMAAWSSLEDITLCLFKETEIPTIPPRHKCNLQYHKRTIQHDELVATLDDNGFWQSRYWHEILWWPHMLVVANIAAMVHGNVSATCWTATVEWLYVRKPGELAGRFWEAIEYLPVFITLEGSLIRLVTG